MPTDPLADAAQEVLIRLSGDDLDHARAAAARRGVNLEDFLVEAVRGYLVPITTRAAEAEALGGHVSAARTARLSPPLRILVRLGSELVRLGWVAAGRGRYSIAPGLITNGRLRIRGPGRIRIGRDLNAWTSAGMSLLATYHHGALITVGDRVRFNGAAIHAATRVDVGDDAILGGCSILDTDHHPVHPQDRRSGRVQTRPVKIGHGVWIGGAVILKGVTIGDGAVVGAGSIVTADVPPGVVVAGNPARVVRRFDA